jgi:hypothetical protein
MMMRMSVPTPMYTLSSIRWREPPDLQDALPDAAHR